LLSVPLTDNGTAPARRPLIGITSYLDEARWGVWRAPAALIPAAYVRAVERAGGRALVVPPSGAGGREVAAALDGLILSGGGDIDPIHSGGPQHPAVADVDIVRDHGEFALLRAALELDLPVLGICRGMQLLNVALGGDLVAHVPDHVGHNGHKREAGAFHSHDVRCVAGSSIARMLGARASVPSHHHQAVATLGAGLVAVAFADDGLTEAIEDPSCRFCVGVQWHPEEGEDDTLFVELVARARERSAVAL
jgi:gamma-glutamyl-gamma-aminobutyrate hydrolase PuuD